jgi:hypothetical protein
MWELTPLESGTLRRNGFSAPVATPAVTAPPKSHAKPKRSSPKARPAAPSPASPQVPSPAPPVPTVVSNPSPPPAVEPPPSVPDAKTQILAEIARLSKLLETL